MRIGIAVGWLLCSMTLAHADAVTSRNLVYVELGGKAGAYGVGYERAIAPWLGLGVVGSFISLRDQQITTASAYVHATIVRRGKHAAFTELGAVLAHSHIPSPVPDWDGMSDSGGGGVLAFGWERAGRHVVLRAQGAVLAGEGGLAPWIGLAIGVRP